MAEDDKLFGMNEIVGELSMVLQEYREESEKFRSRIDNAIEGLDYSDLRDLGMGIFADKYSRRFNFWYRALNQKMAR